MSNRTSVQWWSNVRDDPRRLVAWLVDQYRGEATAADRILALRNRYASPGSRAARLLTVIANQERTHATWVAELLRSRGVKPVIEAKPERYWPKVMSGIDSLEHGAAVGAHAEEMRLQRLETIANDPDAPADIRETMARIVPQERFHARAFRSLSTAQSLADTRDAHELGMHALGLTP